MASADQMAARLSKRRPVTEVFSAGGLLASHGVIRRLEGCVPRAGIAIEHQPTSLSANIAGVDKPWHNREIAELRRGLAAARLTVE